MIWRIKQGKIVLDFGSEQAALQFLDNYPPHIREKVSFKEINSDEITETRSKLTSDLRKAQRFDSENIPISTPYTEWILSRLEMYDKALPMVQQYEANIREKEAARIASSVWEGGRPPVVNEVWRPS